MIEPYHAVGLIPSFWGIRRREEIKHNIEHLKGLTSLRELYLDKAKITDAGLAHLKDLKGLQDLRLNGSEITDAGLEHLRGLTNLEILDLHGTKVTAAGIKRLKQQLPEVDIDK